MMLGKFSSDLYSFLPLFESTNIAVLIFFLPCLAKNVNKILNLFLVFAVVLILFLLISQFPFVRDRMFCSNLFLDLVYFKVSGDWLLLPALGSEAEHFLSLFHNKFISSFLSGLERRAISCTHIHRCALLILNLIRLEDTQEEICIS